MGENKQERRRYYEKIHKKNSSFAIFLSLFSIVSSVPVKAEEAIEVEARSALLMEASTGKIIYEKMLMKNLHLLQ